jgi:membrane carboxypeptidase/penicillin-binding protein
VSVRPLPLVPLAEVSRWMRLAVVDTVVEGGSTITQQYVKNTYVTGEQTLRRKLAEAAHAWGLERANAKAAILEAYLNTVYFGQGADGVQAAAKTFFSISADRLTLPQAALLAGMIRVPVAYDPFRHPRAALARRATVLARLERHGHLRPGTSPSPHGDHRSRMPSQPSPTATPAAYSLAIGRGVRLPGGDGGQRDALVGQALDQPVKAPGSPRGPAGRCEGRRPARP